MLYRTLSTFFLQMFLKIVHNFQVFVKKYHRTRRQFLEELGRLGIVFIVKINTAHTI